ncbi:hypothetical protein VNO77_04044 [Canavalia gladiata]|uniref:Uncharacterized protein n=1 Tax=Canavalia gladiata TaxID=3824 RepID=A0AAN9N0Z7_CANGL
MAQDSQIQVSIQVGFLSSVLLAVVRIALCLVPRAMRSMCGYGKDEHSESIHMPSIVIIFKCRLQPFFGLVGGGLRMPHIKGHSINIYIHSGKAPAGTMTGIQRINFVWHELSLNAPDNYGAVAAVWTPRKKPNLDMKCPSILRFSCETREMNACMVLLPQPAESEQTPFHSLVHDLRDKFGSFPKGVHMVWSSGKLDVQDIQIHGSNPP